MYHLLSSCAIFYEENGMFICFPGFFPKNMTFFHKLFITHSLIRANSNVFFGLQVNNTRISFFKTAFHLSCYILTVFFPPCYNCIPKEKKCIYAAAQRILTSNA